MRRLLKVRTPPVRTVVVVKNQIHALLTAIGMEDVKGSLQKARKGAGGCWTPLTRGKADTWGPTAL
jgi:hypothetical protein